MIVSSLSPFSSDHFVSDSFSASPAILAMLLATNTANCRGIDRVFFTVILRAILHHQSLDILEWLEVGGQHGSREAIQYNTVSLCSYISKSTEAKALRYIALYSQDNVMFSITFLGKTPNGTVIRTVRRFALM